MEGGCPSERMYVSVPTRVAEAGSSGGLRLAAQCAVRCAGEQVICELCDCAACWT